MRLGRHPPVVSPLPLSAFAGAVGTVLSSSRRRTIETLVRDWLTTQLGACGVMLTSSGTVALTLALDIAKRRSGRRRVVLPAYGCYDLATACDGAGVEVVLYDIDPGTLGPAWDSLERVLDERVAAVVVAHLFGMPVELDRARAVAACVGALLIEDAAQGVGARYHDKALGSSGDLAILSFGRGKGLNGGGGGALVLRSPAFAGEIERLDRELDPAGIGIGGLVGAAVQWAFGRPSLYWIPAGLPFLGLGLTPYYPPPLRAHLSRSASGLLRGALALESGASADRRARAHLLRGALAETPGCTLISPIPGAVPGYLRFPILTDERLRVHLGGRSAARLGIQPGYPGTLATLPGFAERLSGTSSSLDGASCISRGLFTIPTHRWLDVQAVQGVVRMP